MTKFAEAHWYSELMKGLDNWLELAEIKDKKLISELKVYVTGVVKKEYLAGNRAGIQWARENDEKRNN